jgi:hypothetical protein
MFKIYVMKYSNLFFLFTLFAYSKNIYAQDIANMGSSYPAVLNNLKKITDNYKRCNKCSFNEIKFEEKIDSTITGKNYRYLEIIYKINTKPKLNYSQKYYFNSKGYCDSIVINEYDTLQFDFYENENVISFGVCIANKVSPNNFISRDVYPILYPEVDKKNRKCAFIKIQRESNLSSEIPRRWIATLGAELNLKINRRLLRENDTNDRLLNSTLKIEGMIIGMLIIVGIITNWGL